MKQVENRKTGSHPPNSKIVKLINMKKMKYNFMMGLMLMASMSLLSISCGDDEEDDKNDNPKYSIARVDTYAISPNFEYGAFLVNHSQNRPELENSWSTKGASFHVYILQGNSFTDLGIISSKEKSIAESDTKKAVHIEVSIPTSIDINKPYEIVATGGIDSSLPSNSKIVCDAELNRGTTYCPSWYIAQGGSSASSQSNYLMTYEILLIINNTSKPIKVKHKGFETKEKWYSTKSRLSITPSLSLETNVLSTSGDVTSEEQTINAGEYAYIASRYVPTGKRMTNARLVLEIDGKEVKTPAVSSDVSIENGNYYRMNVKWDGTSLEWD